jgi:hypothetical protein
LNLEYVRINNWVYGQNKPWNLYTHHNVGMGSSLGPDGDMISVSSLYHLTSDLQFNFSFYHKRKGEGKIQVQPSKVPRHEKFPTGVVEHTRAVQLLLLFQPDAKLQMQGGTGFNNVENVFNQENQDENNFYLNLRINYNFWEEWWF